MSGSITKYLKSPTHAGSSDGASRTKSQTVSGVVAGSSGSESPATPKRDEKISINDLNRMITENMTCVLKSLKKRRHHKRNKRRKHMKHDGEVSPSREGENGHDKKSTTKKTKNGHRKAATPEEPSIPEVAPVRTSPRKTSRSNHSTNGKSAPPVEPQRLKEQQQPTGHQGGKRATPCNGLDCGEKNGKENKTINAFQLMMSSRHKAIGSNSPGRQTERPAEQIVDSGQKEDKIKRKMFLELWADRKGAAKRKLQEEMEDEYIEHKMQRRAKRLKKLVRNMEVEQEIVVPEQVTEGKAKRSVARKNGTNVEPLPLKVTSRRSQRIPSPETEQTMEVFVVVEDNDEFVRQLSSPLKKRDSLLGYFSKVERTSTSPARQPPSAVCLNTPPDIPPTEEDRPSTRPRRSCANRIKDYALLERSPPKEKRQRREAVVAVSNLDLSSPQGVHRNSLAKNVPVDGDWRASSKHAKLAPVFSKAQPKVAPIDEEKARARHEFLMSGIPAKMRQEIEKRASVEERIMNESPVFPIVSHVQQLVGVHGVSEVSIVGWKVMAGTDGAESTEPSWHMNFGNFTSCTKYDLDCCMRLLEQKRRCVVYDYYFPVINAVKDMVRRYKELYTHFPVYKCYKLFDAIYREHAPEEQPLAVKSSPRQVAKPKRGRRSRTVVVEDDDVIVVPNPVVACRNGVLTFAEKYKPQTTGQILVNCKPSDLLKQFLSSWSDGRQQTDSDGNSDLSNSGVCNHIVLVGPPGCGKTCNVYAVANEMNFNVLEINASSRRKGKIILQELHEATQSHQLRKKEESNVADFFRQRDRTESTSSRRRIEDAGGKKLSLILIEDADVVFEQDDGFVGAINQLVTATKRPIVLTTNNPNCAHLTRYMAENVIRYVAPGISNVAKLLSILTLVERVPIDQSDLGRLYAYNRKDIRKTLLELQFFIQSGGDRDRETTMPSPDEDDSGTLPEEQPLGELNGLPDDECSNPPPSTQLGGKSSGVSKHRSIFQLFSRNQNEEQLIQAPINFDNLWCNMERVLRKPTGDGRRKKRQKPFGTSLSMDELVFFYDNISRAACIQREPAVDRLMANRDEDIAHLLVEQSWIRWFEDGGGSKGRGRRISGVGAKVYDCLRKFDDEDAPTISSLVGINAIRSRVTFCDYEPYLRTVCRYERERAQQERRGSRFYHYFRNFAVPGAAGGSSSSSSSFSFDNFDALSYRFEERLAQPARE